jgi:ankyrin repeat protein
MLAFSNSQVTTVQFLHKHGASMTTPKPKPEVKSEEDKAKQIFQIPLEIRLNPLHAAICRFVNLLNIWLKYNCSVLNKDDELPDTLVYLVETGAVSDDVNSNGETALILACKSGLYKIAKFLLSHPIGQAAVNTPDQYGYHFISI